MVFVRPTALQLSGKKHQTKTCPPKNISFVILARIMKWKYLRKAEGKKKKKALLLKK